MWWAKYYAYATINEFEEALEKDTDLPDDPAVLDTHPAVEATQKKVIKDNIQDGYCLPDHGVWKLRIARIRRPDVHGRVPKGNCVVHHKYHPQNHFNTPNLFQYHLYYHVYLLNQHEVISTTTSYNYITFRSNSLIFTSFSLAFQNYPPAISIPFSTTQQLYFYSIYLLNAIS